MSDLSELRERLHMDVERVIGAAAIVELDADAMREAIIEALEIFTTHKERSQAWAEMGSVEQAKGSLANAAELMAARLGELHRVRVSSEPVEVEL